MKLFITDKEGEENKTKLKIEKHRKKSSKSIEKAFPSQF